MVTVNFERGRWTARWTRDGKTILVFRTREYTDLVAFIAINKPEGI